MNRQDLKPSIKLSPLFHFLFHESKTNWRNWNQHWQKNLSYMKELEMGHSEDWFVLYSRAVAVGIKTNNSMVHIHDWKNSTCLYSLCN